MSIRVCRIMCSNAGLTVNIRVGQTGRRVVEIAKGRIWSDTAAATRQDSELDMGRLTEDAGR